MFELKRGRSPAIAVDQVMSKLQLRLNCTKKFLITSFVIAMLLLKFLPHL